MPMKLIRHRGNNHATHTAIGPFGRQEFIWGPFNDPAGNDLVEVPDWLLENGKFREALRKGVYSIEVDSSVAAEQLQFQSDFHQKRQAAADAAVISTIDTSTNRDMIAIPCIGPGARAGVACGINLIVAAKAKDDTVPLCDTHAHLRNHLVQVPTERNDPITGKEIMTWRKVTVAQATSNPDDIHQSS